MRYRIPEEIPRHPSARLAVRASAPYWAAVVGGFLPSVVWSVANAWFLGCRDARWQTMFAVIGYAIVAGIGAARVWMLRSGVMEATFGAEAPLVNSIMSTFYVLGSMIVLRIMVGRQIDLASYRSTLGRLPWGILVIVSLVLLDRFVYPLVFDVFVDIIWIWGPSQI